MFGLTCRRISVPDAHDAKHSGLTLLDWRRRVHGAYASVRGAVEPAAAHEQWRRIRDDLFAHHPQSPIADDRRAQFNGLPFAAYDSRWRFELEVDTDVAVEQIAIATGTDGDVPFERIGVVHLPAVDGQPVGDLDVWALRSYGGGLFVPMRDRSAGRTTYGGGRYLIDTVKGADLGGDVDPATGAGTLVVDLNFAYHPSCAYDAAWACPLAPAGNILDVEVPAGEQLPSGGWFTPVA
jgi:uncharacterized protein (DUF1684 family)